MSGGIDIIQRDKGEEFLALRVKSWATPLLGHLTWEKVHVRNKSIKDLQSFTVCPILDRIETSPTKALTTSFESPSKMACLKPSSSIKVIALHAANASRTSIVEGISVFSACEPITWPKSFLTTTPILAFSSSTKCAPS